MSLVATSGGSCSSCNLITHVFFGEFGQLRLPLNVETTRPRGAQGQALKQPWGLRGRPVPTGRKLGDATARCPLPF